METNTAAGGTIRFGVYEVDVEAGELRKSGVRLKLQDQPFQVLTMLIRNPGRVVTRDLLRRSLWTDETFVEFDNSLNIAVQKIRRALGDSASNPRFIETVPKKGYRFVYPVANGNQSAPSSPVETPVGRWPGRTLAAVAALFVAATAALVTQFLDRPAAGPVPLTAVPLTSYEGAEINPSFSPDGNQVVFARKAADEYNYDLYVKVIGSGEPLRLTETDAWEVSPSWSPDGSAIAFTRNWETGIYTISPLGGPVRKVAEVPGLGTWYGDLVWTDDGESLLVSVRDATAGQYGISSVSLQDGSVTPVVTPEPGAATGRFALSPDGATLAYFERAAGGDRILYVRKLAGGEPGEVMRVRNQVPMHLAWSGDGREIIYSARRNGSRRGELWRVSFEDGIPRPMMAFTGGASQPRISPAANRLVFQSGGLDSRIWRYPLSPAGDDSAEPAKLLASTMEEIEPSFSPDGRRIAFVGGQSGTREIWICGLDGENRLKVTKTGAPTTCHPSWSPDGRYIAFGSTMSGGYEIYVAEVETGAARRLTTGGADYYRADWSKDGRFIFFSSVRSGRNEIWRIPTGGGEALQITRGGALRLQVSPDKPFVYFSRKDGSLWSVSIEGGDEIPVVADRDLHGKPQERDWTVRNGGVYYVEPDPQENLNGRATLKFLDFESRRTKVIRRFTQVLTDRNDVSPDGKWFIGAHAYRNADLMLVEDFR